MPNLKVVLSTFGSFMAALSTPSLLHKQPKGRFGLLSIVSIQYAYFFCVWSSCLHLKFCYRTVLLHSERMIYFYGFSFVCLPFPLDVLRIYLGPFSGVTCWLYKFMKNFGVIGGQLSFICTIIIRVSVSLKIYFLIFKMNILKSMNDDLDL